MTTTDLGPLESYRVCVGVPGSSVEDQRIVHVIAEDEQQAMFLAGVVAGQEYGLEAANWTVLASQSQTEFMAESGDVRPPMPATPTRRAHVRVGQGGVTFVASEVDDYLSGNYRVAGCTHSPELGMMVIVVEGTDTGYVKLERVLDRLAAHKYTATEVACTEDTEAVMPVRPEPGHTYIHESGDCYC